MMQHKPTLLLALVAGVAFLICFVAILTASNRPKHSAPGTAISPSSATKKDSKPNLLLAKLQSNDATAGELLDGLGSTDSGLRRQAAVAILALRDHYCSASQEVVERGYSGEASDMSQFFAMNVIADLRPHQTSVISEAAQHITFSWMPAHVGLASFARANSASAILVEASFASLPYLSKLISSRQFAGMGQPSDPQWLGYACTSTILGSATSQWFGDQANVVTGVDRKKALRRSAQYMADEWAKPKDINEQIPLLQFFGNSDLLSGSIDSSDYTGVDLSHYKIDWDAPHKMVYGKGQVPMPTDSVREAAEQISFTMSLIQFGIMERLEQSSSDKLKGYPSYPSEAETDAVRVLGCLRPDVGAWVIWERLRELSLHHLVDQDETEDVKADLRALGQIDIPAARLLAGRIASEWAPEQERAATYALGKILGHYAPFLIQDEISQRLSGASEDSGDRSQSDMAQNQIKRLRSMLELGKEKGWFTGDYYGAHDPHAYDLVFDDTPALAKTPQP